MTRKQNLEALKSHPYLGKLFSKITKVELLMIETFVSENEHLDKNDYTSKANRWYLDKKAPKNFSAMWAIVTQLN